MDVSIEDQARQLGWVPKEEFRGPEGQWKDAETFVRDGENILPILRANSKKLANSLDQAMSKITQLEQTIATNQDAIEAMKEHHAQSMALALENQRRELTSQIRDARNNGDIELEDQLRDQLDEVKEQQREIKTAAKEEKSKPAEKSAPTEVDPQFTLWHADNEWFGTDKKLTAYANGLATMMRQDPENNHLVGRAFYDAVAKEVRKQFPDDFPDASPHDKMEGSRGPSRSGSRGKSYNDLPADAKEACDRFAQRLVGPNKAYKDMDTWRKQYAKEFFGEQ